MKKIKFILIAMMAIIMGACSSNDDNEEKVEISKSDLAGEWYTEDASASIDMTLDGNGFSAEIITYEKTNKGYSIYDIETGTWAYYDANKYIRTQLTSNLNKSQVTKDIQVIKAEKNALLLRSETGTTSTYLRIVNTYEISVGQEAYIQGATSVNPSSFTTNNNDVISISNDGSVKGLSYGIGYVTMQTEEGKVVARIIVKSRVPTYTELLDKAPEDVSKLLGKPNVTTTDRDDTVWKYTKNLADPGLSQCVIVISRSKKIKSVNVAYKTKEERDTDLAYIQSIYTYDSNSKTYYDNDKGLLYSNIAIVGMDSDEIHAIIYSNVKVILEDAKQNK